MTQRQTCGTASAIADGLTAEEATSQLEAEYGIGSDIGSDIDIDHDFADCQPPTLPKQRERSWCVSPSPSAVDKEVFSVPVGRACHFGHLAEPARHPSRVLSSMMRPGTARQQRRRSPAPQDHG